VDPTENFRYRALVKPTLFRLSFIPDEIGAGPGLSLSSTFSRKHVFMLWTVVACASDDARTPAVPPVVYRHGGGADGECDAPKRDGSLEPERKHRRCEVAEHEKPSGFEVRA